MRYIAIFFRSYRDTNVHGYTEIDGRIDGERRKYTKSHSAGATSVGPCMHIHSNSAAVLFKRVTANAPFFHHVILTCIIS